MYVVKYTKKAWLSQANFTLEEDRHDLMPQYSRFL